MNAWLRIADQIDRAQEVLLREADTARAVRALIDELKCSRKRAHRLVLAANLRFRREATHTTREQTRDFLRATFRDTIRLARTRQKAMLIGIGIGLQELEMVADPDLRALVEAARSLAVLDDASGPMVQAAVKTGTQAEVIAAAMKQHYGMNEPAELPANTIDTQGETTEGNETP